MLCRVSSRTSRSSTISDHILFVCCQNALAYIGCLIFSINNSDDNFQLAQLTQLAWSRQSIDTQAFKYILFLFYCNIFRLPLKNTEKYDFYFRLRIKESRSQLYPSFNNEVVFQRLYFNDLYYKKNGVKEISLDI